FPDTSMLTLEAIDARYSEPPEKEPNIMRELSIERRCGKVSRTAQRDTRSTRDGFDETNPRPMASAGEGVGAKFGIIATYRIDAAPRGSTPRNGKAIRTRGARAFT